MSALQELFSGIGGTAAVGLAAREVWNYFKSRSAAKQAAEEKQQAAKIAVDEKKAQAETTQSIEEQKLVIKLLRELAQKAVDQADAAEARGKAAEERGKEYATSAAAMTAALRDSAEAKTEIAQAISDLADVFTRHEVSEAAWRAKTDSTVEHLIECIQRLESSANRINAQRVSEVPHGQGG